MTRAAPTKLSSEKDFRFWPYHEMFMNHIKNMGWITSLVITKSVTYYNIANYFGKFRIETIETDYRDLGISTQPTDNIKKLKFCCLYNWLFNSSNELSQDLFSKESDNHH